MNKNDVINKLYQINALTSEVLEFMKTHKIVPKAGTNLNESGKWQKLGMSTRIWNTKFDVYDYDIEGRMRRNGKMLTMRKRQYVVSIENKRYDIYMPVRNSVKIFNPEKPLDKPLICKSMEEASKLLNLSVRQMSRVKDKDKITYDKDGHGYKVISWFPQPYIIGDSERKDLINKNKNDEQ